MTYLRSLPTIEPLGPLPLPSNTPTDEYLSQLRMTARYEFPLERRPCSGLRGNTDWFEMSTGGRYLGDRVHHEDPFVCDWAALDYYVRKYAQDYMGAYHDSPEDYPEYTRLRFLSDLHSSMKALGANLIASQKPVTLFLSGGMDSELTYRYLAILLHNTRAVNTITLRYPNDQNKDDVDAAQALVDQFDANSRHRVIDFDPRNLLDPNKSPKHWAASLHYQCTQPVYITLMVEAARMVEEGYDGTFIAAGEVYIQRHWDHGDRLFTRDPATVAQTGNWSVIIREDEDGCFYRWAREHGMPFINDVFMYTPQALASFIMLPDVQDIISGRNPHKLSLISSKYRIFKDVLGGTEVSFDAQVKRTGYERYEWLNFNIQQRWKRELGFHQKESRYQVIPLNLSKENDA